MMLKPALVPRLSSAGSTICKMIMMLLVSLFLNMQLFPLTLVSSEKKGLFYNFVSILIFTSYFFLQRILTVLCSVAGFFFTPSQFGSAVFSFLRQVEVYS